MQNNPQSAPAKPAQAAPAKTPRPPKPVPPPAFQPERLDKMSEGELIGLLKNPKSTVFEKAKSCVRLAQIGTRESVPAMAPLLPDEKLGVYARFGMEPIPDASVDEAFRKALAQAKGGPLVGLLNSIGVRKDPKAVFQVAKLMYNADQEVAQAAAYALGKISGPEAAKALQDALSMTKGAVRAAVGDAGLACAEGLLERGERAAALSLYERWSRTDLPKPVRLAAMHGTIAAETSLSRPR